MKKHIILILFVITSLTFYGWEPIYYTIKVTNKIIGKKIIGADTLQILEKKAGCKYVDSLKLHALDKRIDDYIFWLPDSLPDGKYSIFYNDKEENIAFIVQYKDHKRNGAYIEYFYGGQIREYGFYLNNCLDKIQVRQNVSGQVMSVYNFINCKLEGTSYSFFRTGELHQVTNYKNGKKNGTLIEYGYDLKNKFPKIKYNFEYLDDERIKSSYGK